MVSFYQTGVFMKNPLSILILLLALSYSGIGQGAMDEGFAMLETQAYEEAADFFGNILITEPDNKTARICYGRAVGLGGDTDKGLEIFNALEHDFPGDYEVNLNLAEALMWKKDYSKAILVYEKLLAIDSSNYVANLGYANANASLKNNAKALIYINKAIGIDSLNQGAVISKKYILLALADEARKEWNYGLSHNYLDQVFLLYPLDKDGLLNRATIYLCDQKINEANSVFSKLKELEIAPVDALLGLSYTSLLMGKKAKSLSYAKDATNLATAIDAEPALYLRAAINEVNTLAINRKYKSAQTKIKELEKRYPDALEVKLAKARIKVWNGNEKEGLKLYEELEKENPASFELYMGMAEAYRSLKERNMAKSLIEQALTIQTTQPDAHRLLNELKGESKTVVTLEANRSSDVGGNESKDGKVHVETSIGDKHRPFIQLFYREATQQKKAINSNQQVVLIGDSWIVNSKLRINGSAGKVFANNLESSQNSTLLNAGAILSFLKKHEIGFKYGREAHNYTVDLINSGIIMNHITGSYSFLTAFGLGTYNYFTHTNQTDGNLRNLLFSSVYYNFKSNPLMKVGFNFSNVTYGYQASELYFSPSDLKSGELFLEVSNLYDNKRKFDYRAFVAFGKQKIEDQEVQLTRRVEALIGFKIHTNLKLQGYFMNSNAAQSNAIGFSFTNYGLRLRLIL